MVVGQDEEEIRTPARFHGLGVQRLSGGAGEEFATGETCDCHAVYSI